MTLQKQFHRHRAELTADLFHGPCDIMRQPCKAFPSLWHHQSHSDSPIPASNRVYPAQRELGGCWYTQSYRSAAMDMELTVDMFHGPCGIMRQPCKAFPSLWHHQSHSDSPIPASNRVYPSRRARGLLVHANLQKCFHGHGAHC